MKRFLIGTTAALAMLAPATTALANIDLRANGYDQAAVPAETWAVYGVVTNVEVSPDGSKVLISKREAMDGDIILEVREMDNLSEPMRRINADPMKILNAQWINDDTLFGTAFQQTRKRVKGQEGTVYDFVTFSYDVDRKKFSTISTSEFSKAGGNVDIVNMLPAEPDHILISTSKDDGGFVGDRFAIFRPQNYYKLNLKTGGKELVYRGTRARPTVTFDMNGNIIGTAVKNGNIFTIQSRAPGSEKWNDVVSWDEDDIDDLHQTLGSAAPIGVIASGDDPNKGIIFWRKDGNDKTGVYEVDLATGAMGREIFRPQTADAMSFMRNSNMRAGDNRIAAIIYPGAKYERHWLDPKEQSLYEKIERQIPNAHQVSITSRSRDGQTMIIRNSGPKDPGSFYMLQGNKLTALGSRNPMLTADRLNDVEYHVIKARDGQDVPIYVTKPKGEGPWPTVVMPHGGPMVNEVVGWDHWGQMLAHNGYMVIQPQYRGGTGYGKKHWESSYGEHGGAMQDDKDDAAMWAVEQGWADPDRLAMHGFSYGGYAAAVAASREDQIYQCTIAGAAVLNAMRQTMQGFDSPYAGEAGRYYNSQRGGKEGIDPINEISKVNVPMYVMSGAVDSRVMPYNHTDYEKAVKKAGKTDMITFRQIKDMDHGGLGMQFHYDNAYTYNSEVLRYLKEDCGPGGL